MSAAGASGGPLANSIPTTMATLPHTHEEAGITGGEGDESSKGATTPDNVSDGGHGEKSNYLNDEEEEEQEGARQMSAITQTWGRNDLIAVYVLYVNSYVTENIADQKDVVDLLCHCLQLVGHW